MTDQSTPTTQSECVVSKYLLLTSKVCALMVSQGSFGDDDLFDSLFEDTSK